MSGLSNAQIPLLNKHHDKQEDGGRIGFRSADEVPKPSWEEVGTTVFPFAARDEDKARKQGATDRAAPPKGA